LKKFIIYQLKKFQQLENQRKDLPDLIYKDQFSKWNAIAQACNEISSTGQPILIGTTTVEKSEMLAQLLSEYKLSYQILNAKPENVRRESEIVAQAGKKEYYNCD
jgi:preprotein translocase subunit SecA